MGAVIAARTVAAVAHSCTALFGFIDSSRHTWNTSVPKNASAEERDEYLSVDRRSMFVGMTRAMRALLITIPFGAKGPLLKGFKVAYWNLDSTVAEREIAHEWDSWV
jgi:hypothetical protein